jgi:hypothetical protein
MTKIFGIVVTTIYDGQFLDAYYDHFKKMGGLGQVRFYVVGDLSTPSECRQKVEQYQSMGLPWIYLGEVEQKTFLDPFSKLASQIPWQSDNRRNVGFLMAYRDGCDVIVAIDDDNYPKDQWSFLEGHSSVGQTISLPTAIGYNQWFNLCGMMEIICPTMGTGGTVYARGFPYQKRDPQCSRVDVSLSTGKVAVNAGLWSGDPDVDAATRLVTRCEARENFNQSLLLAPGTLMPINTQNTALIREAIPAYYYVKMGHPVNGMKLDRFGDIFSGFFLQKCVEAMGHAVRVGSPVVDHRRSPHNLYKDLWHELSGMVILDDMLTLLETPLPTAQSYSEATLSLAEQIEEWAMHQSGFLWDDGLKAYFQNIAENLRLWVEACASFS